MPATDTSKSKSLESWIGDAALIRWTDDDKLSRYNHTSDAETYRPIAEIAAELDAIEAEAKETDTAFRAILKQLGV